MENKIQKNNNFYWIVKEINKFNPTSIILKRNNKYKNV